MDKSDIAGLVILIVCCWGSGAVFYGIGRWAAGRKTPMHFWAGSEVDPKTVSDIPAYNRENGRMWKQYSLSFFLAGGCIGHCGNVASLVRYCGPDCAVPCLYCGNLVAGKKLPEDPKPIFGY